MTSPVTEGHAVANSGDLVQLDYELWAESAGKTELLDTTREEVAQGAGFPPLEGHVWGPRPHEVGGEMLPRGIEAALVGAAVGKEFEKEFAPAEAFGERDPDLIELFSRHEIQRLPEMRRDDAHLELGSVLTIEGRRGRVVTLTEARVRVDFNPPFAGRRVKAKFRVVEKIEDPAAQARAIVELHYGHARDFHVDVRDKGVTIKISERAKFDPVWIVAKARVVDRIRQRLHPEHVRIVEEYVTPAPAQPAPPSGSVTPTKPAAGGDASAATEAEGTPAEAEAPATSKGSGGKRAAHSGGKKDQ
jgi:FKBP-type peptidyl-prolyl cis-trans isomerase 2